MVCFLFSPFCPIPPLSCSSFSSRFFFSSRLGLLLVSFPSCRHHGEKIQTRMRVPLRCFFSVDGVLPFLSVLSHPPALLFFFFVSVLLLLSLRPPPCLFSFLVEIFSSLPLRPPPCLFSLLSPLLLGGQSTGVQFQRNRTYRTGLTEDQEQDLRGCTRQYRLQINCL